MKIKEKYEIRAIKILENDFGSGEYGFENITEILDWAMNNGLKDIEKDLNIPKWNYEQSWKL